MRREMVGIVVPGKLYGAMASARPTLFIGPDHCESADTVRQSDCGLTIRLGDADNLVSALTLLANDPELVERMGRCGRAAFLAHHERAHCCARWNAAIDDLFAVATPNVTLPVPAPHPDHATVARTSA
jgi:colanic acid biosynthesis glycosyl transferase WcaI